MSAAREQPALDPADLPGVAFDDRWRLPIVDAAALAAACERTPSLSLAVSLVRDATPDAAVSGFGLQARAVTFPLCPLLLNSAAPPLRPPPSNTATAPPPALSAAHPPSYSQLDIVWLSPARLRMFGVTDLEAGIVRMAGTFRTVGAMQQLLLTILRHFRLQDRPPALVFSNIFYPAAPPIRLNLMFALPLVWRAADGSLERCAQAARCREPPPRPYRSLIAARSAKQIRHQPCSSS